MKKPPVIHPFLFAIFPVLFLYSHNVKTALLLETLIPLAFVSSITLLLFILFGLILRNNIKAGIVLSIFFILSFSYGHAYNVVRGWSIGSFLFGRTIYLLPLWVMLFICCAYFIIKTRHNLYNFTSKLNLVAIFLVAISLINITVYKFKAKVDWKHTISRENLEISIIDSKKSSTLPDIYYIIFDRYASASTLKKYYDFDNSKFISYLSNLGFYVASESKANYVETSQSLASSLNMEFINYLSDQVGEESNDGNPVRQLLQDYKVWRFLKSKGYKFIHFGSWWSPTRRNKYADMNYNYCFFTEFSMALFKTTMFYPISRGSGIYDERFDQWKRVQLKFEKLAEIPNIEEPTFTFVHMLIPHWPYVFDKNGNFLTEEEVNNKSKLLNYVDQLVFTNKKIKVLIDKLLTTSEVAPIVILQADEGPYPLRYELNKMSFNWQQARNAEIEEKMKIFNAYYLPDVDNNVLYPSITPVNSFRLIFNLYFDTHFKLLPDKSYVFLDWSHPYKFFNVTDKVK